MGEHCMNHAEHDRAIASHDKRLEEHGREIDQLRDCVTRLTALQEADAEWRTEADKRIGLLEAGPAQRWEQVAAAAIATVVGAIIGMGLADIGIVH